MITPRDEAQRQSVLRRGLVNPEQLGRAQRDPLLGEQDLASVLLRLGLITAEQARSLRAPIGPRPERAPDPRPASNPAPPSTDPADAPTLLQAPAPGMLAGVDQGRAAPLPTAATTPEGFAQHPGEASAPGPTESAAAAPAPHHDAPESPTRDAAYADAPTLLQAPAPAPQDVGRSTAPRPEASLSARSIEGPAARPRETVDSSPEPPPGSDRRVVAGRYALERELGRGGMGVVYGARDLQLARPVAIKIARRRQQHDELRLRFEREVKVTARLEHPGVPPVQESGLTEAGEPFLAMRLIEGETLSQRVRRDVDLAGHRRAYLEILVKICDTLAFAHEAKILHRDLKPANIMIGAFGEVFVMDWGIALDMTLSPPGASLQSGSGKAPRSSRSKAPSAPAPRPEDASEAETRLAKLTLAGSVLGTPGYMSPEQAEGLPVDPRSDVFSLGAILTELLCGQLPAAGDSSLHRLTATLRGQLRGPRDLDPRVPRDLDALARRCLSPLDRRLASAAGLAAELRRALANEPIEAYSYGIGARALKAVKRRPAAALVAVLALLAVATVSLVALKQVRAALAAVSLSASEARRARGEAEANAQRAEANAQRAELERASADRRLARLTRLSDIKRLAELEERAMALVPVDSKLKEPVAAWLRDASALLARRPLHEETLEAATAEAAKAENEESPELSWERQILAQLVTDIGRLETDLLPAIRARQERAATLRARSLEAYSGRWGEARAAVAEPARTPQYKGFELPELEGLVPLGPDPASGLWEFGLIETGALPTRDAAGRLLLTEESCAVLVLIPAGRSKIGSSAAYSNERPVYELELPRPFLLGKHELTQAQWRRVRGRNPSFFQAEGRWPGVTSRHPVESVSWRAAASFARELGCALPPEARWEYATRAGSASEWWCEASEEALESSGNLAEQSYRTTGGTKKAEDWNDGAPIHAPVGLYAANKFGLHDVIGNVWEWCADGFAESHAGAPKDGRARFTDGEPRFIVVRGGSFEDRAIGARSAQRTRGKPDTRSQTVGVRLYRALD